MRLGIVPCPLRSCPAPRVALILCALAAASAPGVPASAQLAAVPMSVEVHAGALAPAGDWDVEERDTSLRVTPGPMVGVSVRVGLTERLSMWGSVDYGLPGCRDCAAVGLLGRLSDAGVGLGLGYELPEFLPLSLRIDLGGIAHRISFRGDDQTRPSDTGFGARGGLVGSVEVRPSWFIEPSIGWQAYSARFEFDDGEIRSIRVRSFIPRVGLRYRIG